MGLFLHEVTIIHFPNNPVLPTGLTHDTPPPDREVTGERPDPDLPPQFEPTGKTNRNRDQTVELVTQLKT